MTTKEILDLLTNVKATGENQWMARCPAHEDRDASLSVAAGDDKTIATCHAGCTYEAVTMALGLGKSEWYYQPIEPQAKRGRKPKGKVVCSYKYLDLDGHVVHGKDRMDPKRFVQWRPGNNGTPIYSLKGVKPIIYHWPEIHAADPFSWVCVAEGEKDCDNLAKLGFPATCNPGGAGNWHQVDDSPLHGRLVAIIPDQDDPGRAHAQDVARSLLGKAAEVRIVELPGEGKDASDWIETGGTADQLAAIILAAPPVVAEAVEKAPTSKDGRTIIHVVPHLHVVTEQVLDAMSKDDGLYAKSDAIIKVLRTRNPRDMIHRPTGCPIITDVTSADLRVRLSNVCKFVKDGEDGQYEVPPPTWLAPAIIERGEYPTMRVMAGISEAPILRPDGTIHQTPGYDPETGYVYLAGPDDVPPIPSKPGIDEAEDAVEILYEVIADFPMVGAAHKAAWLAATLTPIGRAAFEGPAPMFVFDANIRGSGKTLAARAAGWIALGHDLPVSAYTNDDDEMRKIVLAVASGGDSILLFDNIIGQLGGAVLDAAVTSSTWRGRILGRSEEATFPLRATWYATGNNIMVAADTFRRLVPCRIDCPEEHPEERPDTAFRHPNLLAWISENRPRLLNAGLTILSAYMQAGRPQQSLQSFGSFEGWSELIRSAIVWAGQPDPLGTRGEMAVSGADTVANALGTLLAEWSYVFGSNSVKAADVIRSAFDGLPSHQNLKEAIEEFVSTPPGKPITAKQFGSRLRHFRKVNVGGRWLDGKLDGSGIMWWFIRERDE